MYKFGKTAPRQLESFGVAGVLGDEARVFYQNLFTTHHVGRIGDLVAARLRTANSDELRLRALLLYIAFEAYEAQSPADSRALRSGKTNSGLSG